MAKTRVKIDGLDGLTADIEKRTAAVDAAVREAARDASDAVVATAQRLVHVDSGDLRRGIEAQKRGDGAYEVGIFKSGLYYAWFEEYGTSLHPAHPFLKPAIEAERPRFSGRIADAVKRAT